MRNTQQDHSSADGLGQQAGFHVAPVSSIVPPASANSNEPTLIGKGLVVRGDISGSDPLLIEGRAEGNIVLQGNRVTVGPNGHAAANIVAREVVVLGKVRGNVTATERIDIRAEASVVGELCAPRICLEDGAFFKGSIDIRPVASNPSLIPAAAAKILA